MINLKTAHEIDLMARAGTLLASVLPPLRDACVPGVKTIELDRIAEMLIRNGGATPGFLGYHGYPRSICVSINDEAVHGIPGSRKVAAGDLVSLDLGLVLDGFWADVGITVGVGKITKEAERLLKVTEEALHVGIAKAQPGGWLGDISSAIQKHVEASGFSVIRQFVGHGIGRQMHEDPQGAQLRDPRDSAPSEGGDDPGDRADGQRRLPRGLHEARRLDDLHRRRRPLGLLRAHGGDHRQGPPDPDRPAVPQREGLSLPLKEHSVSPIPNAALRAGA